MTGWDILYADPNGLWYRFMDCMPLPNIALDWISQLKRTHARDVYDLGCGLGRYTSYLAEQGFCVTASDISPRGVQATRQRLHVKGLRAYVLRADMLSIPFPDESFDAVVSMSVLEHTVRSGLQQAISEIHRVLRPGGRVLASFVPRTRWIPKDEPGMDMLEDNTLRCYGPEQLPHHLVDEAELRDLFGVFTVASITRQSEQFEDIRGASLYIVAAKTG
jgi:SAM-dependent methyltransferase